MCDTNKKLARLKELKRIMCERKAKELINNINFGTDQRYVEVIEYNKQTFATRESDDQEGDFYFYSGPSTERDFCKYMFKLDKVFSSGEVQQLGQLLGYMTFDGLDYVPGEVMPNGGPGGPNCRHYWSKFRGKFVLTPAPTENQIKNLITKSVFE